MKRWLPAGLIIAGIIALWEWVVATNDIPAWKLPAPTAIGSELWTGRELLLGHTWVTVEEVLIGFAVALICGVTLAFLINSSRTLERVIYPGVVASQTIPIIVIAPLLLIWLGYGLQHKVFVVALISFFPIVVNTVDGLKSADPDMVNLLKTLGANRWQILRKVHVPSSLPFLFSGIKIAITVSVIGAVIGEWVGSSEGLGYLAIRSKSQFLSERVYATVVLLSLMGIVLFLIAGALERMLLPWYHNERRRRTAEDN
ncbi:MAG: nitrate ABC transporter permease [SAR202 cluster bacterium Io17-Chloro-G9]|nr:MAG: nitrate ABC transporter permease [SAR202 cluster bacterium Io17-Chloro-G9]